MLIEDAARKDLCKGSLSSFIKLIVKEVINRPKRIVDYKFGSRVIFLLFFAVVSQKEVKYIIRT